MPFKPYIFFPQGNRDVSINKCNAVFTKESRFEGFQEVFDGEVRLIFGSEKFFVFPMSAYT